MNTSASRPRLWFRHILLAAITLVMLATSACSSSSTTSTPTVVVTSPLDVWVAPNAANGDGSHDRPFGSLTAARDAVRSRAARATSDLTVHLANGTYTLTHSLDLSVADSGSGGHNIIWRSDGGAAIISGGIQITNWHAPSGKSAIWTATAPATLETRQLYINGKRAQTAQGLMPAVLTPTADGYEASNTVMASWSNPSHIELVYPSQPSNWTEVRCRVASITGTHIVMQQPCFDNSSKRATPGTPINISGFGQALKPPAVVANARELQTTPGQWYLDPVTHLLSYYPLPGQDMARATVVAPAIDTLVDGSGDSTMPIHNIRFVGITFAYAGWNDPSGPDGYSSFQAGARLTGANAWQKTGSCPAAQTPCAYMAWSMTPGNVSFTNDQNIAFEDDKFTHLGAAGLSLGDASQSDHVTGNLFTDISSGGLTIGGIDAPDATGSSMVSGVIATDNYFTNVGVEYQDAPAVVVGYAQKTALLHNQIDHVPYSGISIGWGGWQERFAGLPPLANYSNSNVISNNLVMDHMTTTIDGGGIYTNGVEGTSMTDAEIIENNVVLKQAHPSWAIYTDNGTMYVKVENNVVWDALYIPLITKIFAHVSPYFSFGGCGGGPIAYDGNHSVQSDPSAGLISAETTCGGHALQGVTVTNNHILKGWGDVPSSVLRAAGVEQAYAATLKPEAIPTTLPAYTQFP